MNKNRVNEPDNLQSADSRLQKNLSENIPVILLLGLCLLAVSVFSSQQSLFQKYSAPGLTASAGRYIWITGSSNVEEGLYLLTPEQLKKNFPELLPLLAKAPGSPEPDSMVPAFQFKSDLPQPVNLPPAVANIFFQPISINRAGKEVLSTLPGIGPLLADRIIHIREVEGPFRSKDELLHISGIGLKKIARLTDYIIID